MKISQNYVLQNHVFSNMQNSLKTNLDEFKSQPEYNWKQNKNILKDWIN